MMNVMVLSIVWRLLGWARLAAVASLAWSSWVLCGVLLGWPADAGAQGVGEAVAVARATGEIAQALPTDVTRLALQVAIVSILANAALIGAFYRAISKFAMKPCIMGTEPSQAIMADWFRRAFRRGVEKADGEDAR